MTTSTSPIFIVGCDRSGTTLLRLMLTSHPEIGIPPEGQFAMKLLTRFGSLGSFDEEAIDALIEAMLQYPKCREWGLDPTRLKASLQARHPSCYADCVRGIYEEYLAQKEPGKVRWGDKNPAHILRIRELNELFPDALFLHLVRDGRDVAISLRESGPARFASIVKAANYWQRRVAQGHEAGSALGPKRYRVLRYEDLVRNAESSLRDIADFCRIAYTPAMLHFHEQNAQRRLVPQHRLAWHRNTLRPVTDERVFAWKHELNRAESLLFEKTAGRALAEFGYELQSASALDEFRVLLMRLMSTGRAREGGEVRPPTESPLGLRSSMFLGIGAQRAATGWLFRCLREHPEVWVAPIKEMHYFDRSPEYPSPSHLAVAHPLRRLLQERGPTLQGLRWSLRCFWKKRWDVGWWCLRYYLGIVSDSWYLSMFPKTGFRAVGEVTPGYSMLRESDVQRMHRLLPDARIIYLLRNPIDRAWSQACHAARLGRLDLGHHQDVVQFLQSPALELRGDYQRTLTTYLRHYPAGNILVAFYDAVRADPEGLLSTIHGFLGVEPARPRSDLLWRRVDPSPPRDMPDAVRKYLVSRYAPLLEWLTSQVGGYARGWLDSLPSQTSRHTGPKERCAPAFVAAELADLAVLRQG